MNKVIVLQACDGFTVVIQDDDDNTLKRVWINQEDGVGGLVNVFEFLGFPTTFEEDY
ncbi:hypothetical protein [Pseudomonas phage vB_PsaM_M1]|nr:hypothetical protein [Pseudomonas phage vB_PsaM_M1]